MAAALGIGVLAIISLTSSSITISRLLADAFPGNSWDGSSRMRFAVGLDSEGGLTNAGGHLPDIQLFNEFGVFLGSEGKKRTIHSGTTVDVKITQDEGRGQQPTYALFTAKDDAICIAYLTQTWPDDQKYGWLGDWGRQCGASWYYSNIVVNGYKPTCMWIDGNGDAGPFTAFHVHFSEFTETGNGYNKDPKYYCNSGPPFRIYKDAPAHGKLPIYWYPPHQKRALSAPRPVYPRRRSEASANNTRLVVSADAAHKATDLCQSDTSSGPDFVSIAEGFLCEMSTKRLRRLCGESTSEGCFDVDSVGKISVDSSGDESKYSAVIRWD